MLRVALLHLHDDAVDLLHQQHQHPGRHQRRRSPCLPCTSSIALTYAHVQIGQSLVIACSIALNDFLHFDIDLFTPLGEVKLGYGLARGSRELQDRHMFSFYLMLPLIGVCLAMLKHNWCAAL
jgi:hypothetical protein